MIKFYSEEDLTGEDLSKKEKLVISFRDTYTEKPVGAHAEEQHSKIDFQVALDCFDGSRITVSNSHDCVKRKSDSRNSHSKVTTNNLYIITERTPEGITTPRVVSKEEAAAEIIDIISTQMKEGQVNVKLDYQHTTAHSAFEKTLNKEVHLFTALKDYHMDTHIIGHDAEHKDLRAQLDDMMNFLEKDKESRSPLTQLANLMLKKKLPVYKQEEQVKVFNR